MWFGLDTQIFDWDNKTIKINIDERVAKNQTTDKKKSGNLLKWCFKLLVTKSNLECRLK